jgi:hypothetical protein
MNKESTMPYEFNLRSITTPLLIILLKKEIRFPWLFMLKCKLTVNQFKKRIDPRFPKEFVELVALPVWVYLNLKEKIGQPKALEIMRIALLTGGVAMQSLLFDPFHTRRTFDHFIEKELEINRTGTTRWNTLEIVERTSRRFEIKIVRCLYHELVTSLGIPEVTPLVCQIDNAVFNSYLPDQVTFHRGGLNRRIADGSGECNFIWENIG